ncbi:MAG: response regulator transcription factor [Flavobacteriaceae bacterium]
MIKVVLAEDHQALIDGVVSFFEYNEDIQIIGTAINGVELLKLLKKITPDVVITDIRMPIMDGIEATKIIKKDYPNINVLTFSMFDQPRAVRKMMKAGAHGYILKNSGLIIMKEAIKAVSKGKIYFDPNVLINLESEKNKNKLQKKGVLSKREKEILELISRGKQSIEISELLFISKYTVDTHRKNMLKKLNLSTSTDLIQFAVEKKYDFNGK